MLEAPASVGSPASVPPAKMKRDLVAVFGGRDGRQSPREAVSNTGTSVEVEEVVMRDVEESSRVNRRSGC